MKNLANKTQCWYWYQSRFQQHLIYCKPTSVSNWIGIFFITGCFQNFIFFDQTGLVGSDFFFVGVENAFTHRLSWPREGHIAGYVGLTAFVPSSEEGRLPLQWVVTLLMYLGVNPSICVMSTDIYSCIIDVVECVNVENYLVHSFQQKSSWAYFGTPQNKLISLCPPGTRQYLEPR